MPAETEICAQCGVDVAAASAVCQACGEDPRLDRRYRLQRRLGHGAVGTTFAARRESDGAEVAVKELLVRRLEDFHAHDLFTREAAVLKSLQHPAIPRYFDDFSAGHGRQTGLYLVTELIEGMTLEAEMRDKRHSQDEVLGIVRELCDVLAYLHGLAPPVVHRDLKLSNVMRKRTRPGQPSGPSVGDDRLMLIDFGSVKESIRLPGDGSTVAGTFGYMPPEQLAGRAGPGSDIYALGVLCVALMTRKPPHELLDDQNRLQWQAHIGSAPLRDLLAEMLESDPGQRLADAKEVARRLDDIRAGRVAPGHAGSGGSRAGQSNQSGLSNLLDSHFGVTRVRKMAERLGVRMQDLIGSSEPGVADPPPPAPRAIPPGFAGRADPVASFLRLFGLLFGGIPLIMFFGFVAFAGPAAGFMLLFVLIGGALAAFGFARLAQVRRLFRDGESAPATIVESWLNTRLRVNGRSPHKITFRYETPDGRTHQVTVSRFGMPGPLRVPGARVYALYDRNHPARATLWPV